MMAYISTYNPPDILHGDTLDKIRFTLMVNELPKDLTGVSIKCMFRLDRKTGVLKKTISVGDGITIIDATAGIFEIDAFVVELPPGNYYYDIQFTEGETVKTFIQGTLKVTQDVTA